MTWRYNVVFNISQTFVQLYHITVWRRKLLSNCWNFYALSYKNSMGIKDFQTYNIYITKTKLLQNLSMNVCCKIRSNFVNLFLNSFLKVYVCSCFWKVLSLLWKETFSVGKFTKKMEIPVVTLTNSLIKIWSSWTRE